MTGRSTTMNPAFAAAWSPASKWLCLTWPLGSANSPGCSGFAGAGYLDKEPAVDSVSEAQLCQTPFQLVDHLWLQVNADDSPDAPTNHASSGVKNPMPGPGSNIVMFSRT